MDAEAAVLARLDRIDALDRRETSAVEPRAALLAELRGLLRDAEACAASHADDGEEVARRRDPAPHGT